MTVLITLPEGTYSKGTFNVSCYGTRSITCNSRNYSSGRGNWGTGYSSRQELQQGRDILAKVFPTVDPLKNTPETDPTEKTIVLPDVKYPDNQFVGASGEYIVVGKPSTGFYFVNIGGREWLGPYEAIKRFRREVDGSLGDSLNFTVLGKITGPAFEIPGNRRTNMAWGWVVEPEALYIDGRIVATFDANHDKSGSFVEEDKVAGIKEGWYTEKSVPENATPERVMEIFLAAIKEKNYELYRECINPVRYKTETAEPLLRYHWDLHQQRLHGEYVHTCGGCGGGSAAVCGRSWQKDPHCQPAGPAHRALSGHPATFRAVCLDVCRGLCPADLF